MNILHVNMSLDQVAGGGTVERTLQLHNALKRLGAGSRILTIESSGDAKVAPDNDDRVALPCLNHRWFIPVPAIGVVRELVRWADVIHMMNHWTFINAWVYLEARRAGKPYIVCPAGAMTFFGRSLKKKRLYQRMIGDKMLRGAAAAIAISPHEVDLFGRLGVNPACIHHIPNGIHDREFSENDSDRFRSESGIGSDPYMLFVGRVSAIKGPDILLDAYCRLKDSIPHHLVFVGPDGGMKVQLEEAVAKMGLGKRVHFTGYLGGDAKFGAYHGAEFLVIPSRHEAMSIVALEGAISGKPVLLTDQCGFSSLVEAGGGIEVAPTVDGITEGLRKMIMDKNLVKDMGERGRVYVLDNFTWSNIAQRFLELADQIR